MRIVVDVRARSTSIVNEPTPSKLNRWAWPVTPRDLIPIVQFLETVATQDGYLEWCAAKRRGVNRLWSHRRHRVAAEVPIAASPRGEQRTGLGVRGCRYGGIRVAWSAALGSLARLRTEVREGVSWTAAQALPLHVGRCEDRGDVRGCAYRAPHLTRMASVTEVGQCRRNVSARLCALVLAKASPRGRFRPSVRLM
jgi:hypothetical protein